MKLEKTHYQSDWAEAGFPAPLNRFIADSGGEVVLERELSGAGLRWVLRENGFESAFYGMPVRELRLEIVDPEKSFLTERMDNRGLNQEVINGTAEIISRPGWNGYLFSKLIPGEPFFCALRRLGFEEVEQRRLYGCRFGDLRGDGGDENRADDVGYCSFADLGPEPAREAKIQVLGLCRESFTTGYTRHYTDPFLYARRPGIEYLSEIMELNFREVSPRFFLVAVEHQPFRVCGFTVVGRKAGMDQNIFTQLLSAVSQPCRGKGIYRRLTVMMAGKFSPETKLLNVTHVGNLEIQRAYRESGRNQVADTVVLRRVFS